MTCEDLNSDLPSRKMTKADKINFLKPIIDNLAINNQWIQGKKSLVMAQVLCESGWLKHIHKNNCLGIKWTPKYPESRKQMLWTHEWVNGKYVKVQCPFMTYETINQCIEDGYISILNLNRYKETRDSIDWWDATNFIRLNGYATSPTYTNTLRKIIIKNKIYEIDFRHDPDEQITKDFKYRETFSNVRIGRKTYLRVIENPPEYDENRSGLMTRLQIVRNVTDRPMSVTRNGCVYRIREYNAQVGGTEKSQHRLAKAGDVKTRGYTGHRLYMVFKNHTDIVRYGIARNWLHVDIAPAKSGDSDVWYY